MPQCLSFMTVEQLRQDVGYAFRGIRTRPAFAAAVIATLALGIGANAAMFGIVDRLLFRPPPLLHDPATAHRIYTFRMFRGSERPGIVGQYARYQDLVRWTTSFSQTAGWSEGDMAVGVGEAAREMRIARVSAGFFGFFDAPPVLGRYFTEAEDQAPAGTPVAVLGYTFWRTRYGGSRGVLDSMVQIGPTRYTIVGVAPRGFVGLWADRPPAAYVPITAYAGGTNIRLGPNVNWWTTYSWGWMSMIARRKPGVLLEAANADVSQALLKSFASQRIEQPGTGPDSILRPRAEAASILAERGPTASPTAKVATWVGGVSVIVLLIACANVANLLLARALHRRREIALRLALGISRARLVSQLLIESVVLALLGGGAGIVIAHWGGAALRAGLLESEAGAGLGDPRTVLFAGLAALAVGVLAGLAPVFQSTRQDLAGDLKAGVREGTHGRSRTRVALLLVQSALSVVLLIGAGLFVRSLRNVQLVPLGFETEPVVLVDLNMRGVTLDSAAGIVLRRRLLETARGIPGVASASRRSAVPFWSHISFGPPRVAGFDSTNQLGQFNLNIVSPEYFATVGTRILRGRGIDRTDVAGAPRAAVIGESMGRVLWPGKDPVGQCMRFGADTTPCTYVVGVAEDIKTRSLAPDSTFYYYLSVEQQQAQFGGLFVRTAGPSGPLMETVRKRLQQEMPGASYLTLTPMTEIVGSQMRSWHLGATMFVAFGLLALVVAGVGLYSVIAYNVQQRTHELGVRMALGARAEDLARLVVLGSLRFAAIGVAIGAGLALWAGRFVADLLFKVSPQDPAVFLVVTLTLGAVAVMASWIPAVRASRVEPNVVLRAE